MRHRIITFDGGGVFGMIPATLVSDKHPNCCFDAFGGTSIGSCLAAWYAFGKPPCILPGEMATAFPRIFSRPWYSWHKLPVGPKWPNDELVSWAKKHFPDYLGNSPKPLYIVSFDFSNRRPKVFSSDTDKNVRTYEAILASVAAPTYFAPHGNYVDGGIWANNPSVVTVAGVCEQLGADVRDIDLLSIGTGRFNRPPTDMSGSGSWWLAGWGTRIMDALLEGGSEIGWDYIARQLPFRRYVRYNDVALDNDWSMDDAEIVADGSLTRAAETSRNSFSQVWDNFLNP